MCLQEATKEAGQTDLVLLTRSSERKATTIGQRGSHVSVGTRDTFERGEKESNSAEIPQEALC